MLTASKLAPCCLFSAVRVDTSPEPDPGALAVRLSWTTHPRWQVPGDMLPTKIRLNRVADWYYASIVCMLMSQFPS